MIPSAEDGLEALREQVAQKAAQARALYPPPLDRAALVKALRDPRVVRCPVELCFDAEPLGTSELAWLAEPGALKEPYRLFVHPVLADRPADLTAVAVYQLVVMNYRGLAGSDEAELFGATWLGIDPEAYYRRLCELVGGG